MSLWVASVVSEPALVPAYSPAAPPAQAADPSGDTAVASALVMSLDIAELAALANNADIATNQAGVLKLFGVVRTSKASLTLHEYTALTNPTPCRHQTCLLLNLKPTLGQARSLLASPSCTAMLQAVSPQTIAVRHAHTHTHAYTICIAFVVNLPPCAHSQSYKQRSSN